jgi:hypothetical protein
MTIINRPQPPHRFSIWDFCLLTYIRQQSRPDGTFQQSAARIAETLDADVRPIQRHIRDLVAKKYIIEVAPRYRDTLTNWWVPASYQVSPATLEDLRRQRHSEYPPSRTPSDTFETATGLHDTKSEVSPLNPQRHLEHPPAQAPATNVALEALPIKSVDSVSVLGSLDSSVSVVGSDAKSATPPTTPEVRDIQSLQFKKCKSPECWNEAPVDNDFCGVHDGMPPVTFKPEPIELLPAYAIGSRQPLDGFDNARIPFCPFCTGRETVDWSDLNGRRYFEETCGAPACITANFNRLKKGEEVLSESWAQAEARRKREFERHTELQERRAENANSPAFDENGRLKPGSIYPEGDFDEDLVPDCPYCIVEGCDWTPNEKTGTVQIYQTCGNLACDTAREKVLQGQRDYDETISEDFTVSSRDGGAA